MLGRQEQVVTWREAVELLSVGRVRGLLRSGRWRRYGHGVLVAHNGRLSREQAEWVAVLDAGRGALLAGITAARLCGLRGYDDEPIHLLVPTARKLAPRSTPGPVIVHRTTVLAAHDALVRGRPPQTTAARSLVDAAQWAATDQKARAIVAAGVQQRLTAADELHEVLARLRRARRRTVILEAVNDAAGGAHSLPERELRRLCRRYGLPLPDQQVRRRDTHGRQRWLDAYWEPWKLHVEVDGGQHMDVRAWWSDMSRQNSLWVAGDRVLRFPSWAIRHRPHEVADQLRAALIAAGWRPETMDLGS